MTTHAKTDRARYRFKVSEGGVDEKSWRAFISCEPLSGSIDTFGDGLLSFDLPPGTTMEKAEEIADFMDENIVSIAFTSFD